MNLDTCIALCHKQIDILPEKKVDNVYMNIINNHLKFITPNMTFQGGYVDGKLHGKCYIVIFEDFNIIYEANMIFKNNILDGKCITKDYIKKEINRGAFINGEKCGLWVISTLENKVITKIKFDDGVKTETLIITLYSSDGYKVFSGLCVDDKEYLYKGKFYFEDELFLDGTCIVKPRTSKIIKHGFCKVHLGNSRYTEGKYIHDKPEGEHINYVVKDTIKYNICRTNYENCELVKKYGWTYDKDMKLLQEGEMLDSQFHGNGILYFHKKDIVYAMGTFKNGIFHEGTIYDEDGCKKYYGTFRRSSQKDTHENRCKFSVHLIEGKNCTEYKKNGEVMCCGEYKAGKANGEIVLYENNEPFYTGQFIDGILQEE